MEQPKESQTFPRSECHQPQASIETGQANAVHPDYWQMRGNPIQQAQLQVNIQPDSYVESPIQQHYKKIIFSLGISEVVLGSLSVIIGIAELFISNMTGHGIWCGAWVIVCGSLALVVRRPFASICMVNAVMAFSIVAAAFSGIELGVATTTAVVSYWSYGIATGSLLGLIALASLVLTIISAVYTCRLNGNCCKGSCNTEQERYSQQPVVYTGYVNQGQQPLQTMQPLQYIQQPQVAQPTNLVQPMQSMQHIQPIQPIQNMQPKQEMQPIQVVH